VRSFLASRDIQLREGDPQDPPAAETVCGLGNRKDELVKQAIRAGAVEAYPGWMWRCTGFSPPSRRDMSTSTPTNHAERPLLVTSDVVIVAMSIITTAPGQNLRQV
jgi:hypothetical protein